MVERTYSATLLGLEAIQIEVEVDGVSGTPNLILVGLPSRAVDEAKDRITSAILNTGIRIRSKRTVVNLAPATIKKTDSSIELAIAVGILKMYGEIVADTDNSLFLGELSLDGSTKPVSCVLPIVQAMTQSGFKNIYVPKENAAEAAIVENNTIFPVESLAEIINHLNGNKQIRPYSKNQLSLEKQPSLLELPMIHGQAFAKRAITISAAGGHNLLLIGSPGSGKTLLARSLQAYLPPVTKAEAIEITSIHSVAGLTQTSGLIHTRPFRSPHHSTSHIGLLGGGNMLRPGEISLAHRGVLFLDEFPEFSRVAIESLRQPMEEGNITITRAFGTVQYPARFILVAAANPCPCGKSYEQKHSCKCSPILKEKYLQRISGPILDRIDLHVVTQPVSMGELKQDKTHQSDFNQIVTEIAKARRLQQTRWSRFNILTNSEIHQRIIEKHCRRTADAQHLLEKATQGLSLSARGYYKVIKIAQTIADLAESPIIEKDHIAEALQYRKTI